MTQHRWHWIVAAAVGIVIGAALGLAIGWRVWPVTYTNTSPSSLREDFHDEYVLIIATAYETEGDLNRARQRLAQLNPDDPAAPVLELAERLIERQGYDHDVTRLTRLAQALDLDAKEDAAEPVQSPHGQA